MGIDKLSLEVSNADSWLDLAKLVSRERQKVTRCGLELAGAEKTRDIFTNQGTRQNF